MKITSRTLAAGLLLAMPNTALIGALAANTPGLEADPAPQSALAKSEAAAAQDNAPEWVFEQSDVPVDTGFVFGKLDNGMRYILRENGTPEGTAVVRMRIDSGSLEETDSERGLAHYLEHMAFNGSKGIPEGEMIALLERKGLAFGADTNASTGLEAVTYMLNLPRNDEDLLDTALMLMRETASELTISEDAVERERGVILAERRDRRNYSQRAQEDSFAFTAPGARFIERLPIGTRDVIENATAAQMRALYERTYTPSNSVLVIIGDYPVEVMEAALRARFSDWSGGPVPTVVISALGPWIDEPDTLANRKASLLRRIGYGIIQRRMARLAREEDAPFRGAGFGSGDLFEDARSTSLSIASEDGQWRKGVLAAAREVNQALTYGFSEAELAEQMANLRTSIENRVAGAGTRSNRAFAGSALSLVANDIVPTPPEFQLEFLNSIEADITTEAVHEALRESVLAFDNPLIRFQGRTAPEGGETALRNAFSEGMALAIAPPADTGIIEFAYTDFGTPGTIVSDTSDSRLGFRYITFDNGVRVTLKKTENREDRISFEASLDGGG